MSLDGTAGGPEAQGHDRRAHPRFSVHEEAQMLLVGYGLSAACRVLDLSLGGCRLQAESPLSPSPQARVEITFTINRIPFRVGGVIQRDSGAGEFGIRFRDMTAHRRAEWAEIVGELQERAAAHAKQEAASEAVRKGVQEAVRRGEPGLQR